jgi:glycosyltransferase involved in cell wall biosynthesis
MTNTSETEIQIASLAKDSVPIVQCVSAIVATMGRSDEIRPLLESFRRQTRPIDEIVVVDQNEDDRMINVLKDYTDLPILHVHDPNLRGANKSRNHGWRVCTGDIIFFPDDDCYYSDNFIERVLETMSKTGANIVTGRCPEGRGGRYENEAMWVDRRTVWTTQVEWTLICQRTVLEKVSGFDERLGVGAATFWGAGEVQDLSLKAMSCGFREYYDPEIIAHHPPLELNAMDAQHIKRFTTYSRGMGYVFVRHGYSPFFAAYFILRALGTVGRAALQGECAKMTYGWYVFKNRLLGYLRARREVSRYQPPYT